MSSPIAKCPDCGGAIYNKVAGRFICSSCGNSFSKEEVIIEEAKTTASTSAGASGASGSAGTYNDYSGQSQSGPNVYQTDYKQKGYRKKGDKVITSNSNIDWSIWIPLGLSALSFIIMIILFVLSATGCIKVRFLATFLIMISVYFVYMFALWPVFDAAGQAPWKALVPVYNMYTLYEMAGYKGYFALLFLVPYIGNIGMTLMGYLTAVSLAEKFGMTRTQGVIMLFIMPIAGWSYISVNNLMYNAAAGHQKDQKIFGMF